MLRTVCALNSKFCGNVQKQNLDEGEEEGVQLDGNGIAVGQMRQKIRVEICSVKERREGVNFIDFLQTAFTLVDPKSSKMKVKLTVFLTLSGTACAKAAHRTLMKLTQGRQE